LRFGVTTELDILTTLAFARAQQSRRTQFERTDLAELYSAGSPVTSPRGLGTQFGIPFATISQSDAAAALLRGRIAEGADYLTILYEPGAPVFTTITGETLVAVIAAAQVAGEVEHSTSTEADCSQVPCHRHLQWS